MKKKKTGLGLKALAPNILLTRLPILLPQIKAENNLCKLENGKYYIFCISLIKLTKILQQFNQVILLMEENMIVIRDPKTFAIDFD